MKTVIFLRHAKSDWDDHSLADIDRPLAPRGRADAPRMGAWLTRQVQPDLALISPAVRAQQTFETTKLGVTAKTIPSLYPTNPMSVLEMLLSLDNKVDAALIIGHNPGIAESVRRFLNQPIEDPKLSQFPTCACAVLSFKANEWDMLEFGQANLSAFMIPKSLK